MTLTQSVTPSGRKIARLAARERSGAVEKSLQSKRFLDALPKLLEAVRSGGKLSATQEKDLRVVRELGVMLSISSGHLTSDRDCFSSQSLGELQGWRSPNVREKGGGDYSDPEKAAERIAGGHQTNLADEALVMSGWESPSARDHKDTPGMATEAVNPDGSHRDRTDQLPQQVASMAGWSTPRAMDSDQGPANRAKIESAGSSWLGQNRGSTLSTDAHLVSQLAGWVSPTTPSGGQKAPEGTSITGRRPDGTKATLTLEMQAGLADVMAGSGPATQLLVHAPVENLEELATDSPPLKKSKGALSPQFVSWLQSYPQEWLDCAPGPIKKSRQAGAPHARRTAKKVVQV